MLIGRTRGDIRCNKYLSICQEFTFRADAEKGGDRGCDLEGGAYWLLDNSLPSRTSRAPTRKYQSVVPNAFAITSGKKPVNDRIPNTPVITPVQALTLPNPALIMAMLASSTPSDGITMM